MFCTKWQSPNGQLVQWRRKIQGERRSSIPHPFLDIANDHDSFQSVDALAREEAVFAAKTRAVAEIKAATPFGSTPAILARHQRRMQDLAALEKTRSTKAAPVPFWNRTHSTNRFSRPSSPERVEEEYQLDTPQSSSNPNRSLMSDFS